MTVTLQFMPGALQTEFRLVGDIGPTPADAWAIQAPKHLLPALDLLRRLEAAEQAISSGDVFLVDNVAVAALSGREATTLGLPALTSAVAQVATGGVITSSNFAASLDWRRPNGQPILGVQRTGAFLQIGGTWERLPEVLFGLAEAVEALNDSRDDDAARFKALADLRDVLPGAQDMGAAYATGLVANLTISVADAFSLDLDETGAEAKLIPILHRAAGDPDEKLLADPQQEAFGRKHFNAFGTARAVYALGNGHYVVLAPTLRRALDVVRRTQSKPMAAKRALLASPRTVLREALGDELDETVLEAVVCDTAAYSERVLGLGLWQKRVLPWVNLGGTDWFDGGPTGPSLGTAEKAKAPAGLIIGDRCVELTPEVADTLRARVEQAIGQSHAETAIEIDGEAVKVPATHETLAALQQLEANWNREQLNAAPDQPKDDAKPALPTALIISANENEIEVEGVFSPRKAPSSRQARSVATALKQHQVEGIGWLTSAYAMGRPGVLLADDMGLGKTLQGLAFLAWLREGMASGDIARAPVAVVAPTGLLENWKAEEKRHLSGDRLGNCLEAFGQGLSALKSRGADGRPTLDIAAISAADWVLTTYETLRDFDKDFGAVRFAAMLFDEAQKIKTPGVRVTDAAKAMNVDFRVALTGTPVENRLADLWCISDAVHPAMLGDLKTFSDSYERSADPDRLRRLKGTLDSRRHGEAPFLLRRMKRDRLPDLPLPQEAVVEERMSGQQLEAYKATVAEARASRRTPGAVFGALQNLRRISLHPDADMAASDDAFIAASARCRVAFRVLDAIKAKNERVLIFVDDLNFQARLASVLQRRYGLKSSPAIINGSVSGRGRQARVDHFQQSSGGFDVMILSPRAGGVGLTLTAANHAIHLSRWWNPAVEDQCTGRVLRIGQTRPVHVHLPLSVLGDGRSSFDQNLDLLIRRKRLLFEEAFMPPEATSNEAEELFTSTVT